MGSKIRFRRALGDIRRSLRRRLLLRKYPFLSVPGMMGIEERLNLFNTCRSELTGAGSALEFGAFFGASTAAIQAGLRANPQHSAQRAKLRVVDCFCTPRLSTFAAHVRELASLADVTGLLNEKDDWLFFDDVFLSHINIEDPYLVVDRCLLADFSWTSEPVEFLHLDLPKDWSQASYITTKVFPSLLVGARVLFQDFGYQWSAELIAMVGHLTTMGFIRPYRLTDTTLSAVVEAPFSSADMIDINSLMGSSTGILRGLDDARRISRELDATLSTEAVILAAKAQYYYQLGDVLQCFEILSLVLKQSHARQDVIIRISELLEWGFTMKKSYESHEVTTTN